MPDPVSELAQHVCLQESQVRLHVLRRRQRVHQRQASRLQPGRRGVQAGGGRRQDQEHRHGAKRNQMWTK